MQDQQAASGFYDRISVAYDALADASEHRARERGLELLSVRPGETVLEIGFGTGHSLVTLAEAVGPRGAVHGVDISQGMHDVALRRVEQAGLAARVKLGVCAAPPLPHPDATFDAVTLSFTLELFPPDARAALLAEIGRVLEPRGRLGVVSMALVADGERESVLERAYKWMHRHFPHIVDCEPIDVGGTLAAVGFAIEREERLEIWSLPVAVVVARPRSRSG